MAITLRQTAIDTSGKASELSYQEMNNNLKSYYYSSSLASNVLNLHFLSGSTVHSVDLSGLTTTDTNIANSSLSLSSNRTVTLNNYGLTFDAINGETFTVAAESSATVLFAMDTSDFKITGLPNTETPLVLGYNSTTGVLSYYSTASFGGGGTTSPGGSDTQVQFNDGGAFGGDSGFTYNSTSDTVTITSVNSSTPSLYVATTETTPALGDVLGEIEGYSTQYSTALGGIQWVADGGWSGGDYPTRVDFQTIADGGTTVSTKMSIKGSGRVGIGTTNPTNGFLEVNGDVSGTSVYASANIVVYSDARSKTNVETITGALDKINAIRGVTYNKVEDPEGVRYMGVVAQELQEVLPEVVAEGEDGRLAVAYGNIVGVLIEAVKELKAEIAELKANK